jgi:hypothetical protein
MQKSKPGPFCTPRTGVAAGRAHPKIEEELVKIWGRKDAERLLKLWRETQVRGPYNVGEIEDLFFGIGGD